MTALTISALPQAGAATSTDIFLMAQGATGGSPGITSKMTMPQVAGGVNATNGRVNIASYGGVGDDATDNLAAFVAAMAALPATGGIIDIPPGNWRFSATVAVTRDHITIRGAGRGATTIKGTLGTTDIVSFIGCSFGEIADLTITNTVNKTAGAGLRFRNGHNLIARNVQCVDFLFSGIELDGGGAQFIYHLENCEIDGYGTAQYGIIVSGDGSLVQDVMISGCTVGSMAFAALYLVNVSGMIVRDCDFIVNKFSVLTNPAAGQQVVACFFDSVQCDTGGSHGWQIVSTGGTIAAWVMEKCWASSCGTGTNIGSVIGDGVHIDATAPGVVTNIAISSLMSFGNVGAGLSLNASGGAQCTDVRIVNAQCTNNSRPSHLATTATAGTGVTATITFPTVSFAPGIGSLVTVTGVTPAGYNVTNAVVTASTTSTVSYANATTGAQSVAGVITIDNKKNNNNISIGVNTTDFAVIGGRCGNSGFNALSTDPATNYGVLVAAGASDRYVITGVNAHGNITAGVSDGGAGVNKSVTGNIT